MNTKNGKDTAKREQVWKATVYYNDKRIMVFCPTDPDKRKRSQSGYLNAKLLTIKDAHEIAFGQAGFNVNKINLQIVTIEQDPKDKSWKVIV